MAFVSSTVYPSVLGPLPEPINDQQNAWDFLLDHVPSGALPDLEPFNVDVQTVSRYNNFIIQQEKKGNHHIQELF